ncbi:MAG: DNA repair protein RadC [Clostridia bacterium]|nr:DNA repair protein RadC [Clostridia bacterium]
MAKNPHDNHRERLRARFLAAGESFEDHELLELMLFYCIPRVNTNEIAHRLLERFGSIKGVFNAGPLALMTVDGIGESSALYIRAISEAISRYSRCSIDTRKLLDSREILYEYMQSLFIGTNRETFYLILLTAGKRLILCEKVGKGNAIGASIDPRSICQLAINTEAAFAIVAHNHPDGKAIPSGEDLQLSEHLEWMFNEMQIKLIDHFIVAENKCVPILNGYKSPLLTNE